MTKIAHSVMDGHPRVRGVIGLVIKRDQLIQKLAWIRKQLKDEYVIILRGHDSKSWKIKRKEGK